MDYLLHKYSSGKLMVPHGGQQHADFLQVILASVIVVAMHRICLSTKLYMGI